MSEDLIKAQDIFLEKINKICRDFGLNNIMAQLYVVLYFNGKPLSLNDMLERLKISKGSVSVNIRFFESYGAVKRVWIKGSRRDYYEAEPDIAKVITDRVKSMAERRLSEIENMIDASDKSISAAEPTDKDNSNDREMFKERLSRLKGFHGKMQSLFNFLNANHE